MKKAASTRENKQSKSADILETIYNQPSNQQQIYQTRRQMNVRMARWFFNYEDNQLLWSDGLYEILEMDSNIAVADNDYILEIIHPDDKQIKIRAAKLLRTEAKPVELNYRLVLPDGRIKWINEICSTEFDKAGLPVRSLGTIQDITKYKMAEERFKQNEKRFKKVIESFAEGVIISDNTKCIFLNSAAKNILFGSETAPVAGKNFLAFVHPESKAEFSQKLQLLTQSKKNISFKLRMLRDNSSEFTAQVTLSQAIYQDRLSVQIIFTDLTEKPTADEVKSESDIELRKQLDAKDKFLSIIAHDLRNPLNSLLAIIDLLQDTFEETTNEEKKGFIELIRSNTSKTLILLEDLLNWSKVQSGEIGFQPTYQNFSGIINNVTEILQPALKLKNITLQSLYDKNIVIFCDTNMIRTVMQNLIHNAIKYSNADSSIEISAALKKDNIEIKVADHGIGMSKETLDSLFKIGWNASLPGTYHEEGNGLGLLLCKELIEKHGGKIWAESEPLKGSQFTFSISQRPYLH
jgi:PAS domain S-box-containing protein